jgi:hypothetical protein
MIAVFDFPAKDTASAHSNHASEFPVDYVRGRPLSDGTSGTG